MAVEIFRGPDHMAMRTWSTSELQTVSAKLRVSNRNVPAVSSRYEICRRWSARDRRFDSGTADLPKTRVRRGSLITSYLATDSFRVMAIESRLSSDLESTSRLARLRSDESF